MIVELEQVDEYNLAYACALFKELHGLSAMSIYPFDEEFNRATCNYYMRQPHWWVMLAKSVDRSTYTGVLVGNVQHTLFCDRKFGAEQCFYVREGTKFRGLTAMKLVNSFVSWCYDVHDCIMVQSGDIASINGEAARAVYIRCGFKNYGALYSHERNA